MKSFFRRWKFLLIVLVMGIVGLFIWSPWKAKTPALETLNPEVRNLRRELSVSGTTDAFTKASLRFLAGGKIARVGASQGDRVTKNQLIAAIDRRELEKSLSQQLNAFTTSRIEYDQTQDTYKDVSGNKSVDRILAKNNLTLQSAALSVELKDLALKNATLTAPFDGILVSAPAVVPNSIVTANDSFFMVDPNSLFFEVEVDESNISLVKVGQQAKIVLDAFPEEPITSTVRYVAFQSTEGDAGTVFRVRLDLPELNDVLKYRLGMNGSANILIEEKNQVLSVPLNSVIEDKGVTYVEVLTDSGKTERKAFQKGIETDEYVEVIGGLTTKDKVIKK